MHLLDVNVLIAAHRSDHRHHTAVRGWLQEAIIAPRGFCVPEVVAVAFVRVSTNRRVFNVPTDPPAAFDFLEALRGRPTHAALHLGDRGYQHLRQVCVDHPATGDLVPDAHLVALAIEHACTIASIDRDFARFDMIEWVDPVAR